VDRARAVRDRAGAGSPSRSLVTAE